MSAAKAKPFKLSDLNNLDTSNPGGWPIQAKIGACVVLGLLVVILGWFLVISDQRTELQRLEGEEAGLRTQFEELAAKAANLEPLKQQLVQMEAMLKQMLRQLPGKTEMSELITDISQTAIASGIAVELFQPDGEVKQDFYAEQPIKLRMVGNYHQFGGFVSGVASLPRVVIMTFHDISLAPREAAEGAPSAAGTLELQGTIKTYRYLDDGEVTEAPTDVTPSTAGGA
jgi:type IV pilus assembly protein PilO